MNGSRNCDKAMGEVRVKVKLFNATDEGLVRRGLLKADQIRVCETEALVDTGAVRSVIRPSSTASGHCSRG